MRLDIELHHALITRTMHAANRNEGDADATMRYVAALPRVAGLQKALRETSKAQESSEERPRKKAKKSSSSKFPQALTNIMAELKNLMIALRTDAEARTTKPYEFRGTGKKDLYTTGPSFGMITSHQLAGHIGLSNDLVVRTTTKLRKKLESIDDVGRSQIQEVIDRSFEATDFISEQHFWGADREGAGFSTIVKTGGRVQTFKHRSGARMFSPSLSRQTKDDLISGDIQVLVEACVKLLGFSRQSWGIPLMGEADVIKNAVLDVGSASDDEETVDAEEEFDAGDEFSMPGRNDDAPSAMTSASTTQRPVALNVTLLLIELTDDKVPDFNCQVVSGCCDMTAFSRTIV